jgi:UDP-2,4-diacetamido-2,4,6-trideoxy-beta-L-altropyranose hydrolase
MGMRVAVRVDAAPQMGSGHLMRCLTLANALKNRGAETRFVSRQMPESLRTKIVAAGHGFAAVATEASLDVDEGAALPHSSWLGTSQAADARGTSAALEDGVWDWVIVDHYALDERWERVVGERAEKILAIDDLADRNHDCDLLLDQNFYADQESRYDGLLPAECVRLCGPRYALLRDEFRAYRAKVRARVGIVARVLVSFGGMDADNYTGRALNAILGAERQDLRVDVVIGAQHPKRADIERTCATHAFACHVQSDRMAELMATADLSIGAGGATTWERCCLGLPTLAIALAQNQRQLVDDAARAGLLYAPALRSEAALTVHLKALLGNPLLLEQMSRNSMSVVDALGVDRVMRSMGCASVAVRPAVPADSDALFAWRNDSQVRAVSRSKDPIPRAEHEAWLAGVLADPQRRLLIGEREGSAIGAVRFDLQDGEAEVSIYMAPGRAGSGAGSSLLDAAQRWLVAHRTDVRSVRAEVLGDNQPSHRLFRGAGYALQSTTYVRKIRAHA